MDGPSAAAAPLLGAHGRPRGPLAAERGPCPAAQRCFDGRGGPPAVEPRADLLVGVTESQFSMVEPMKLLKGDIVLRIGLEGAEDALYAPFPGGLHGVQVELARRSRQGGCIAVQAQRANSQLELTVEFQKPSKAAQSGPLAGVKLEEGKYEKFAPLTAITEMELIQQDRQRATHAMEELTQRVTTMEIRRHRLSECASTQNQALDTNQPGIGSCIFTTVVMPQAVPGQSSEHRLCDLNHTVQRATEWLAAARAAGVPLRMLNIQAETIPVRSSTMHGERLDKLALHGRWTLQSGDCHKHERICVLRAVRLWLAAELEVEVKLEAASGGTWGLHLAQGLQGFFHIQSITPGSPGSQLEELFETARASGRVLTITRVERTILVPAMLVEGEIDCANLEDVEGKLALLAAAGWPLYLTMAL
eukprot:SM000160S02550  [mRNA]  locus=s160:236612:239248:+ [translate_table: standard]